LFIIWITIIIQQSACTFQSSEQEFCSNQAMFTTTARHKNFDKKNLNKFRSHCDGMNYPLYLIK
jgi:hypothetical protein